MGDDALMRELESELKQHKQENQQLKENVAELNAQLLKSDLESGRKLLHLTAPNSAQSFAAEIDTMSKDDVILYILIRHTFRIQNNSFQFHFF